MKPILRCNRPLLLCTLASATLAWQASWLPAHAAAAVGSTAPQFTVSNHKTGQPLRLADFQGSVILLDFWAYWCGPCASAAEDMEPNIVRYYRNAGGSAQGLPVAVISISVDPSDPAAVDDFISTFGLEVVADDTANVYSKYGNDYIPYMVVINGTTNATNYKSWEVLHSTSGYSRAAIKSAINAVQTPPPICTLTAPLPGAVHTAEVALKANVVTQGKIIKKVEFRSGTSLLGTDTNAPYGMVWTNPAAGPQTVTARVYYGTSSSVTSAPVSFTVGAPPPIETAFTRQGTNVVLSWSGGTALYQVQVATQLPVTTWHNVGGPATNMTLLLTPTNPATFYRILKP